MDSKETLEYLQRLCVRRECCRSELLTKAVKACEGRRHDAEEIVDSLAREKFFDDARYAGAFAREKSTLTGWGPAKIRQALIAKGISREDISTALETVDSEAASTKLEKLVRSKAGSLKGDPYIKFKLIKYALGRGYDYDEVSSVVESALKEITAT